MQDQFRNSLLRSRPGKRALSAFRAVRALPERYRRELTSLEAPEATWRGNRVIFPDGRGNYYSVYAPSEDDHGLIHRTYDIFRGHGENRLHRLEVVRFIQFAKRCRTFLDIGCAEGALSALFVAVTNGAAHVLSVDCGAGCHWDHLVLTRRCNLAHYPNAQWETLKRFVTSENKKNDPTFNPGFPLPEGCVKTTLQDIVSECSFKPDMIKLDIEGSEYEVVLGGIGVLRELRPLLQIELHKDNMPPGGSAQIVKALTGAGFSLAYVTRPWSRAPNGMSHVYFEPHP
jgi:FkbM family methyltransferase